MQHFYRHFDLVQKNKNDTWICHSCVNVSIKSVWSSTKPTTPRENQFCGTYVECSVNFRGTSHHSDKLRPNSIFFPFRCVFVLEYQETTACFPCRISFWLSNSLFSHCMRIILFFIDFWYPINKLTFELSHVDWVVLFWLPITFMHFIDRLFDDSAITRHSVSHIASGTVPYRNYRWSVLEVGIFVLSCENTAPTVKWRATGSTVTARGHVISALFVVRTSRLIRFFVHWSSSCIMWDFWICHGRNIS